MDKNRLLPGLLFLSIVGLMSVVFFTFFEFAETEHLTRPHKDVVDDPFYALERIFGDDIYLERYDEKEALDLKNTSYLILNGADLSYLNTDFLQNWIAEGGRLEILLTNEDDLPDESWWNTHPFLSDLRPHFDPALYPSSGVSWHKNEKGELEAFVEGTELSLTVEGFVSFPNLKDDEATLVVTKEGTIHAALRTIGKGFVFVSGRPFFMWNSQLKKDQNLIFVSELFRGLAEAEGGLYIPLVQNSERPKVPPLNTGPVFISILALCFFFFWMKFPRLGPLLPEPAGDRRSLGERFLAEGRFLWRYGAGEEILKKLEIPIVAGAENQKLNNKSKLKKADFMRFLLTEVEKRKSAQVRPEKLKTERITHDN